MEWIPVTESQPDIVGAYLCTVYGDSIGENYVTMCSYSCKPWHAVTGWFNTYCEDVTQDVRAWMPLPEPYEDDEL